MAGKAQPTVRDRQVGIRLRTLRDARQMTLEQLAVGCGLSESTLHRIETGKRRISTEEVAMITTALMVPIAERQELIDFVVSGDKGGWWERPLPGVPKEMGLLASYEAEANGLTDWSVLLVPGLLQIEPYARAFMLTDGVPAEEADLRWVARKRRQEILGTIDYTAFIYEGALHVPFGGPEVHGQQIRHLMAASDRGIAVRVVREHLPISALSHSWLYMTFPSVPPVVNVDVTGGGVYLQGDRSEPFTRQVAILNGVALSASETRATLRGVLKEIRS
ncbi:MAG: helix-turn-helix transcriptional regulator [Actinophytocola sp.]|uniref:helix-turn-helix domain-containing protein n=1 Tax=Actinophytocola sp. TaxID=1872138 RepID=UPI003C71EFF2